MAAIVKRGKSFYVVYSYKTPKKEVKQRWECFHSIEEAKKRKAEIEYKKDISNFTVPGCTTVDELLTEYTNLYDKSKWAMSTYQSNLRLMENYIRPIIGGVRLEDMTTRVVEKYYQTLLKTEAAPKHYFGWKATSTGDLVTPQTVRSIHKLLRNCFGQAVKWELMEKNPCINATVPKPKKQERDIWDAETLFHAIDVCEDERLKLAMHLAFACTLRIGELLGLTWDGVDISEKSIMSGEAHIQVNKELQRINQKAYKELDGKDVILEFPQLNKRQSTIQVLKTPKTISSVRRIFLPPTVARMLADWKKKQDAEKEALGAEYSDYNLVFAGPLGMPTEGTTLNAAFRKLIEENDLPPVVFHSIRHTSITYKLKLNGGDIKSVQGDSGHSQAKMVTDQYSHILDADRKVNARLFEKQFYRGEEVEVKTPEEPVKQETPDAELLMKALSNPEMVSLLKAMMKAMGNDD